jgi:hypothetical protein
LGIKGARAILAIKLRKKIDVRRRTARSWEPNPSSLLTGGEGCVVSEFLDSGMIQNRATSETQPTSKKVADAVEMVSLF